MNNDVKQPRWFSATATKDGLRRFPASGLYFYVRKSHQEGRVQVFNGRHMICDVSEEEARKFFKLDCVARDQVRVEEQYQWYLNY